MIQLLQTAMPPSNLAYLIAAFAVTGVVFVGYVYYIFRRRQETQRRSTVCSLFPRQTKAPSWRFPDPAQ